METTLQPADRSYLKGKSRHLFWPFLAFFIIMVTFQYIQSALLATLVRALRNAFPTVYIIAAVAFAVVYLCGMGGFLLAYGTKSTVKAHRTVFIVLAVFTLLTVAKSLISSFNIIARFADSNVFGNNLIMMIMNDAIVVLPLLVSVAWISCLSAVAAGPRCGGALRASAIVLALTQLFFIVYTVVMPSLASYLLIQQNTYELYTSVNNALLMLNSILQVAAMAFFFAALSFSKPKTPKDAAAAAGSMPVVM